MATKKSAKPSKAKPSAKPSAPKPSAKKSKKIKEDDDLPGGDEDFNLDDENMDIDMFRDTFDDDDDDF